MGLTPIKTISFFFISQVGMLLGTIAYVNAGLQLSNIKNLKDIISPQIIISFAILGTLPLIAKKIIEIISRKRVYKNFKKPKKFDYNMIVIGAGSAGLVTSYITATVNARVALVEKDKMGGDCLNTGCVPSKAIIKTAKVAHYAKRSQELGIKNIQVDIDFKDVMERVHKIIKTVGPHDSVERYSKLGVDCLSGEAKIISPWEVEVNKKIITTRNITIATGASPRVPNIEGLDQIDYLTSNTLWKIQELPKKLVVLGGGPIGLEMAQAFSRLGSEVTVIHRSAEIMAKEDSDISDLITDKLKSEGVTISTMHSPHKVIKATPYNLLICKHNGKEVKIPFNQILIATGRVANIQDIGLENLNIKLRKNGTIDANQYLQTNYPNIFVCGDVTGPYQLTHMAAHQAWYCAVNALFGKFKKFKVDYRTVPWTTYTDPEVATVGLNEKIAKQKNIPYEVTKYGVDDLDRAIADSENYGIVKVLTVPGKDKILGATIVSNHASDILLEFVLAMKYGLGLNKILGTIHTYPSMGEANKYLAGAWKMARKPEKILYYLEKYHSWQRK